MGPSVWLGYSWDLVDQAKTPRKQLGSPGNGNRPLDQDAVSCNKECQQCSEHSAYCCGLTWTTELHEGDKASTPNGSNTKGCGNTIGSKLQLVRKGLTHRQRCKAKGQTPSADKCCFRQESRRSYFRLWKGESKETMRRANVISVLQAVPPLERLAVITSMSVPFQGGKGYQDLALGQQELVFDGFRKEGVKRCERQEDLLESAGGGELLTLHWILHSYSRLATAKRYAIDWDSLPPSIDPVRGSRFKSSAEDADTGEHHFFSRLHCDREVGYGNADKADARSRPRPVGNQCAELEGNGGGFDGRNCAIRESRFKSSLEDDDRSENQLLSHPCGDGEDGHGNVYKAEACSRPRPAGNQPSDPEGNGGGFDTSNCPIHESGFKSSAEDDCRYEHQDIHGNAKRAEVCSWPHPAGNQCTEPEHNGGGFDGSNCEQQTSCGVLCSEDSQEVAKCEARPSDKMGRGLRKQCQVQSIAALLNLLDLPPGSVVVDFGSGSGALVLPLAAVFPDLQFVAVDFKYQSIKLLCRRAEAAGLSNISTFQGMIHEYSGKFDACVALHACGKATDDALKKAFQYRAAYIMSPCCVGKLNRVQGSPHASCSGKGGHGCGNITGQGKRGDQGPGSDAVVGSGGVQSEGNISSASARETGTCRPPKRTNEGDNQDEHDSTSAGEKLLTLSVCPAVQAEASSSSWSASNLPDARHRGRQDMESPCDNLLMHEGDVFCEEMATSLCSGSCALGITETLSSLYGAISMPNLGKMKDICMENSMTSLPVPSFLERVESSVSGIKEALSSLNWDGDALMPNLGKTPDIGMENNVTSLPEPSFHEHGDSFGNKGIENKSLLGKKVLNGSIGNQSMVPLPLAHGAATSSERLKFDSSCLTDGTGLPQSKWLWRAVSPAQFSLIVQMADWSSYDYSSSSAILHRMCKALVELDRNEVAQERGYHTYLLHLMNSKAGVVGVGDIIVGVHGRNPLAEYMEIDPFP